MPGPASFAGKYPQFTNQMPGAPWMANSGSSINLANILAGAPPQAEPLHNPTMVGTGGLTQMGGGFQKPGGKPSIGTAGGGGKPSIGYGGGPSPMMWRR